MTSSYSLVIDSLELTCSIGILASERERRQTVLISLRLDMELARAIGAKSINEIVDYGEIVESIKSITATAHIDLVEQLAIKVLTIAFSYKEVQTAEVTILKPEIIPNAKAVGCRLFVHRRDFEQIER